MRLKADALERIDEIAGSFEDFVSRAEVIEMALGYVLSSKKRTDEAFGPETETGEEEGAD